MARQKRYYNYDSNADSTSENIVRGSLHPAGVYQGMDLVVTADHHLTVAVGAGLQPDGILWTESFSAVPIDFFPPSLATTYSVVATHDNRLILGGVEVAYALLPLEISSLTNGVVLGWIYHPGGGVDLLQDHVVSAPKVPFRGSSAYLTEAIPVELIPPFSRSLFTSAGLDITITPVAFDAGAFVLYQGVANSATAVALEQAVQQIQLYCDDGLRPCRIDFYFLGNAPPATNLQVEVYGTDLTSVSVVGSPLSSSSGVWEVKSVLVSRTGGVFTAGQPYTIRLTYRVDRGREIRLGRIRVGRWPYPGTP